MKEQVKEWIVDKNLTTDSFDSIMIGVIYNSGHSTLDDPDVRKWIETHPSEFRGMLPPKLTDDQQVVLEWLKDRTTVSSITSALWLLLDDALEVDYDTDGSEAWNRLPIDQKFQVLAAFADWGMKSDQED